jgi:hypothetical protein
MAVMPVARLFFPCARVDEHDDGKITITDPIDAILIPVETGGKITLGPLNFYALVKEGLGRFYFRIEAKDEDRRRLAKSRPREIEFISRSRSIAQDLVFDVSAIPIRQTGIVRFELYANELVLSVWEIRLQPLGD